MAYINGQKVLFSPAVVIAEGVGNIDEIIEAKEEALESIAEAKDEAILNISDTGATVLNNISDTGANAVNDIETAKEAAIDEIESSTITITDAFLNPNNLITDPLVKDASKWKEPHVIVETDSIANGFELINDGTASVNIIQNISASKFVSGHYCYSFKSTLPEKTRFMLRAIGSGEIKEIIRIANSEYGEFDLDMEAILAEVPTTEIIEFRLSLTNKGTNVISEIYLGLYNEENNDFWRSPIGRKADKKAVEELQNLVDAQSEAANPLYGKIITFNGDSICEARATNGGGYATIIGERNNMTVENIGVSGATIMFAEGTGKHCISRTVANMREDADYIILEGGVNDLYSDRPLGTMSNGYNAELDDTTFYGAFENMLKQALIRFHGKKIGYIAVHKMTPYFDSDNAEDNAYHAAIKCCKKWGVPVCDLNNSCPPFGYLRENTETVFITNLYTEDTATAGVGDGWHPNEEGYKKYYVPKIEAWLKTL